MKKVSVRFKEAEAIQLEKMLRIMRMGNESGGIRKAVESYVDTREMVMTIFDFMFPKNSHMREIVTDEIFKENKAEADRLVKLLRRVKRC